MSPGAPSVLVITPPTLVGAPSVLVEAAPSRSATRSVLGNSAWNAAQQSATILVGSLVGILMITRVSVSAVGVYSYATAITNIAMTVMIGGLASLAVKEMVNDRPNNADLVTSVLVIREFLALVAYTVMAGVALASGSRTTFLAVLLAGVALFGRGFDATELWFLSHLRSSRTAPIRLAVTAGLLVVRVVALYTWPSIWLFLAVFAVEPILGGLAILRRYRHEPASPGLGHIEIGRARALLRRSWPLMISGLANQLNLKADLLIIEAMLGSASVGIYSAAARLSELAYFLPTVLMNSSLPVLLAIRNEHGPTSRIYRRTLQRSYDIAFWSGVGVAVVVSLVGPIFITHVFGPSYAESKAVLAIHIAACPFVFMGAVQSKYLIAEGLLWSAVTCNVLGAAVNVAINIIVIPRYGIIGASWATVCSYTVSNYLACAVIPAARPAAAQMTLAISAPVRLATGWRGRRHG